MGIPFTFTIEQQVDLVARFEAGESIPALMESFGCGRNRLTRELKELLGDRYVNVAQHVMLLAQARGRHARKGKPGPKKTPEWIAKIAEGNRGKRLSEETRARIGVASRRVAKERTHERTAEIYGRVVATKRARGTFERCGERHAEWMREHAPMRGKHHTEETRARISESKQRFFENGGVGPMLGKQHSDETKAKCSRATTQMWLDGRLSYGHDSTMRSRLERHVFDLIKARFPDARHSFVVRGEDRVYVFDACVPSLGLLVEVNGDYWHLNPALYESTHRDGSRDCTAQEVWDRDAKKRGAGEASGRRVVTLWERDLKDMDDDQVLAAVLGSKANDDTISE